MSSTSHADAATPDAAMLLLLTAAGWTPPAEVRLAARRAVLYYDQRVELDELDAEIILAQVRSRIFNAGVNAAGRQMPHAKSYQSPRDLYRFLKGDLYNSMRVARTGRGVLELVVDYDPVILAVLEDLYGAMFTWSPADVEFVDAITRDKLRIRGVPKSEHNADAERLATERAARARLEADRLAQEKQAYLDGLNARLGDHIPAEDRPADNPSQTRFVQPGPFLLQVDPNVPLGVADLLAIRDKVVRRIRVQNLNYAGRDIPKPLAEAITRDTYNSVKVSSERPGVLRMDVVYRNTELPALEKEYGRVFGWSRNDIYFVDELVKSRAPREKGLTQTKVL